MLGNLKRWVRNIVCSESIHSEYMRLELEISDLAEMANLSLGELLGLMNQDIDEGRSLEWGRGLDALGSNNWHEVMVRVSRMDLLWDSMDEHERDYHSYFDLARVWLDMYPVIYAG